MHTKAEELYCYAIGYYDGRVFGNQRPLDEIEDGDLRLRYREGYDAGVADFCEKELEPYEEV
jgi:hypothetical protein